jgi:hypothetical protein
MPGDDAKGKDASPEPTMHDLLQAITDLGGQVKDLSTRVQALETAAPAPSVAMPEGFSYGLPGYGGIPPISEPEATIPPGSSAPKKITEIQFPHSPSQPPVDGEFPST